MTNLISIDDTGSIKSDNNWDWFIRLIDPVKKSAMSGASYFGGRVVDGFYVIWPSAQRTRNNERIQYKERRDIEARANIQYYKSEIDRLQTEMVQCNNNDSIAVTPQLEANLLVLGIGVGNCKHIPMKEVREVYKKQALKHHPDKGGGKEKFQEISSAYESIESHSKSYNESAMIYIEELKKKLAYEESYVDTSKCLDEAEEKIADLQSSTQRESARLDKLLKTVADINKNTPKPRKIFCSNNTPKPMKTPVRSKRCFSMFGHNDDNPGSQCDDPEATWIDNDGSKYQSGEHIKAQENSY